MDIRWGIVGCGDIVRKRVARAIQDEPHSRLLAVCRRDLAKLTQFAADFQVPHPLTDATQVVEDPQIDAVYIATPVHLHHAQCLQAAAAGKHVLVEKPMAMSVAECADMVEACERNGVKLGVAYYRRFYPIVRRMEELIRTGIIGRPLSISAATSTAFAIQPGQDGYWRVLPDQGGGGALMDIGSHRLNLFLHLFGEVVGVKAFCDTVAADYASEDIATLVLRFESGAHGVLQCHFGTATGIDSFSVMGTEGRMSADPLNGAELEVRSVHLPTKGQLQVEHHPPPSNLHAPLIADFVAAILEDRAPTVSGAEGLLTNAVMEAAYQQQ